MQNNTSDNANPTTSNNNGVNPNPAPTNVGEGLQNTANNVSQGVQDFSKNAQAGVENLGQNVQQGINNAGSNLQAGVNNVAGNVGSAVGGAASTIKGVADTIGGKPVNQPAVTRDERLFAALAYIPFVALISLIMKPDSSFVRMHARQGLMLSLIFFCGRYCCCDCGDCASGRRIFGNVDCPSPGCLFVYWFVLIIFVINRFLVEDSSDWCFI